MQSFNNAEAHQLGTAILYFDEDVWFMVFLSFLSPVSHRIALTAA